MIKKINENNNVLGDGIGFIHEYDFSRANSSHESRLNAVTSIASVCYAAPDKIGNQGLYDRLANEDIGIPSSSFSFIPVLLSEKKMDELSDILNDEQTTQVPDLLTFGEMLEVDGNKYLLSNLRALLQDLGWVKDFKKAQELSENFFNTDEKEIEIIRKNYKVYKVKIDIATSKQWNRHWYHLQELSRRYVSGEKVPFEFYVSDKMKNVESSYFMKDYNTSEVINICLNHYKQAIKQGVKPQDARRILPQAAYTEIWTGMIPRVYENMLKLRTKPKTQWEFRQLALQIAEWDNWREDEKV